MSAIRNVIQPLSCSMGFHAVPPPRNPPGPIVSTCPCCKKPIYCYGMSVYRDNIYPSLLLPSFPKVLPTKPKYV